jgi:ketosteroid isomerase-like protein
MSAMRAVYGPSLKYICLVLGPCELAWLSIERWHAGDLDAVFATWDPQIIVRPDPYYPDSGELLGAAAARRFWEDQREFSGAGRLEILEEHDLGDRCLMRIRQHIDAPASGVHGSYEWSYLVTAREGRVALVEFFIDRDRGLAAAGLKEQA